MERLVWATEPQTSLAKPLSMENSQVGSSSGVRLNTSNTDADISLASYIKQKRWIMLLFIPAAFSFICPTEVLAFHNCIEEFKE